MFETVLIGGVELLFGVAVDEQGNSKHVTVGGFVSNTFACGTLNPRFEWTSPLVRASVPALRHRCRRAFAMIAKSVATPTVAVTVTNKPRSVLSWAGDGTVVLAVHTIHAWEVTLDEKVRVRQVVVVVVVVKVWADGCNTVDTGGVDVADAVFSIVVD